MRKNSTFKVKVLASMALAATALLMPQSGWSGIVDYTQDKIGYSLNTSTKEATVTSLRGIYPTVTVPDSVVYQNTVYKVTAIGEDANYRNDMVKTVVLGKYVQVIDSCAFQGNRQLASINFPGTLKVIKGKSFEDCYALENVDLPEGLESIGTYAFYSAGLTKLHIPSTVKYIGVNSCRETTDLTSLTVAEGNPYFKAVNNAVLSKDGKTMLFGAAGLSTESYAIPDGVETVGAYAMRNATKIKGLVIPNSVQTVGEEAFCRMGMKSVTIGTGLRGIGDGAFSYCTELGSFTLDPANPNLKCVNNSILSKTGKTMYAVTAQNAVYTVPAGVETIANNTFYGMTKMRGINLTDVVTVGKYAFYHCDSLATVNWGTRLKTIDRMAFQSCGLTSIVLPSSVRTIGYQAFTSCKKNTKIVLPEGITEIGISAFYENTLVQEVKVPSTVRTFGESAFYKIDSLKRAILPDNLTVIPKMTFSYCRKLTEVNYPAALREIGPSAFVDCPITNFDLPATVKVIGRMAFENTKIGPDITLPPLVTVIDEYAFTECDAVKSFKTSPNLKEIKEAGIQWMAKLDTIILNEGLQTIGRIGLAGNVNIRSLTIPSTVTSVGKEFVRSNINMKDLIMLPATPPATSGDVTETKRYASTTLHVLAGSVEAYKAHAIWGKFTNIVGDAHQGVNAESVDEPVVIEIYDITGRRLREMVPGAVNILRMSDGTVRKVMVPSL